MIQLSAVTSETPAMSGKREPHPLAQALVVPVEDEAVARAGAVREEPIKKKRPADGARHGADGQRRDADALDEQQAADDGAETVDERRHGLHTELLAHQKHRAKDSTGKEAQLRGQQNAREEHAERGFLRVKAVEPPADVPWGEDFGEDDGRAQHEIHGGEDDGERALAFSLAARFAIAGKDGDKGDGGRAADKEIGDHVGQDKGGVQRVGLHAAAKEPGDVFDADQADDAREKRGDHEHDGGGKDAVRVRRVQEAAPARPPRRRRLSFHLGGEVQP